LLIPKFHFLAKIQYILPARQKIQMNNKAAQFI